MNLYGFAGGDPVNFSDPLGLCKVQLMSKDVRVKGAKTGGKHTYIVTTQPDNTRTVFRGGPTKNNADAGTEKRMEDSGRGGSGTHGNIATTEQRYRPGGVDFESSPEKQTLVDNDESCDSYHDSFRSTMGAIEGAQIGYSPFGPNSNSVTYQLLKNAGIKPPTKVSRAPGWGPLFP